MKFKRLLAALLSLGLLALSVQVVSVHASRNAPALVAEDPKPGGGG
jgi:hypothetical protein